MTAYLKPGDRILLAVPDFAPNRGIEVDYQLWRSVYEPLGITVEHVAVHQTLNRPVVVAVIRADNNPAGGDPA